MKNTSKFLLVIFIFIFAFSISVFAKEVDIKVDDVKIIEKSGTTVADEPSFDNSNINADVTFTEKDDFVVYEVTIKNLDEYK